MDPVPVKGNPVVKFAHGAMLHPVLEVKFVPYMGPDPVMVNVCGLPSCSRSTSLAFKLKETKSPAFTVRSKEFPGNGGVITGRLFPPEQGITINCISRSTSEIKIPWRYDFTKTFTT